MKTISKWTQNYRNSKCLICCNCIIYVSNIYICVKDVSELIVHAIWWIDCHHPNLF
jgi:hypothetical protein